MTNQSPATTRQRRATAGRWRFSAGRLFGLLLAASLLPWVTGTAQAQTVQPRRSAEQSARLFVSPQSADAGADVTVVGTGFGGGASGELSIDGSALTTLTVNRRGRFSLTWHVPLAFPAGAHTLIATTATAVGSTRLTVLSAPASAVLAPSPTASATPTSVPTSTATPTVAPTTTASPTSVPTVQSSLAAGTTTSYSGAILSSTGLRSYYRLNETSGATAADSTGSLPGTYVGSFTLGAAGILSSNPDTSLTLDPAGYGRVALGRTLAPAGNQPFTWEAWISPATVDGQYRRIIGNDHYDVSNPASSTGAGLAITSNGISFWRNLGNTSDGIQAALPANPTNLRYHVVVTYDGSMQRLYINGALQQMGVSSQFVPPTGNSVNIGANSDGGNNFAGRLGNIAFYAVAIDGTTVRDHYNLGRAVTVVPNNTHWYGAWVHDAGQSWTTNPGLLDTWTAEATSNGVTSHRPRVFMDYESFATDPNPDLTALAAARARGAVPIVTWQPEDPNYQVNGLYSPDQPAYSLQNIVNGNFDAYISTWAVDLKNYGGPVILRFAHEMNGDWYPWSVTLSSKNNYQSDYAVKNSPALYVAAWRHMWTIFHNQGATNVQWLWSPNVFFNLASPYAFTSALYPGDAYVDAVGMDGYNFGNSTVAGTIFNWQTGFDLFSQSYDAITAITTKPIIIAEVASSEIGGSKAAWITNFLGTELPRDFPAVVGVIWFNEDKEQAWPVDSSAASLSAFQAAIASSQFSLSGQ